MQSNVIAFPSATTNCTNCHWSQICVTRSLDAAGRAEFARYVTHRGPIKRGEKLFRQGDKLSALYVIRAGSVRVYCDSESGSEQSIAFQYPGDMLGFDALADSHHPTSAVALETTSFCTISHDRLGALAASLPTVWREIMRAVALDVTANHGHVQLLGQRSALARLASFLLNLANRFAARGCSRTEYNLNMSRQEIANYLAIAGETVSRLFGELQIRGVIAVDRRFVRILSLPALQAFAQDGALETSRSA